MTSKKATVTRPRDASMSLLNNVFANPLDPDYERVAATRRGADEDEAPSRKPRMSASLVLGMLALGLLLSVAIVQKEGTASVASAEREGLAERIRGQEQQTERLQDAVSSLQAEIAELEDRQLQSSARGQRLRESLQNLQGSAGTAAVAGPGASVVLDDAEHPEETEKPEYAVVLDVDLQRVVNGLWIAGAEAISINDQRVTSLSPIRMANNVINVNGRPLSPPYEVLAIGDSRTLASDFSEGPGGDYLRSAGKDGIRYTVRVEESVRLPAGSSMSISYATATGGVS
ncbi:DUF881 domain-containing protein [Phytoactinopolyspora halotolerans]|uniref:DUF881 domain-containing protein n=1 Tax=Phytoactinopolyspora halotolerans TaxID=1981512 RepID=A0A6L9SH82_9ACTN|nr:DUF881 domain-containing protein [Phytoactinopolyspora halotolerans]NEE04014.1 DUF881 domain-containing protein [Phytoactinopolyspora halotolerans]